LFFDYYVLLNVLKQLSFTSLLDWYLYRDNPAMMQNELSL